MTAIQMATINTASYFGLSSAGAIAPGYRADFVILRPGRASLLRLAELLSGGAVRSVVGETLALEQVHEAHRRMESGHTGGKIVLSMG